MKLVFVTQTLYDSRYYFDPTARRYQIIKGLFERKSFKDLRPRPYLLSRGFLCKIKSDMQEIALVFNLIKRVKLTTKVGQRVCNPLVFLGIYFLEAKSYAFCRGVLYPLQQRGVLLRYSLKFILTSARVLCAYYMPPQSISAGNYWKHRNQVEWFLSILFLLEARQGEVPQGHFRRIQSLVSQKQG